MDEKLVRKQLDSRIRGLTGVERTESRFGHRDAYRVGNREFVHFQDDSGLDLDIRVTKDIERKLRRDNSDSRITFRQNNSDWIFFRVRDVKDLDEVFGIVRIAWEKNRRK